jgi:hypothetical protein
MASTASQPFQEGKQHLHLNHGGRALHSAYGGTAAWPASSVTPPLTRLETPASSSKSTAEARQALKIHSAAEKRRRERINAHLATLRRMIPDASQVCTSCRFRVWFHKLQPSMQFFFLNAQLKSFFFTDGISTAPQMINSNVTVVCS